MGKYLVSIGLFLALQPLSSVSSGTLSDAAGGGTGSLVTATAVTAAHAPDDTSSGSLRTAEYLVTVTAYSSTSEETDDSPFITASGTHVRDGVAAANFLPFGTIIKIPELYGDRIFMVEDRLHERYSDRVDIWMPTKEDAQNFGRQTAHIVVIR